MLIVQQPATLSCSFNGATGRLFTVRAKAQPPSPPPPSPHTARTVSIAPVPAMSVSHAQAAPWRYATLNALCFHGVLLCLARCNMFLLLKPRRHEELTLCDPWQATEPIYNWNCHDPRWRNRFQLSAGGPMSSFSQMGYVVELCSWNFTFKSQSKHLLYCSRSSVVSFSHSKKMQHYCLYHQTVYSFQLFLNSLIIYQAAVVRSV
jgi:hypothetical protein